MTLNPHNLLLAMLATLFALGVLTFLAGLIILLRHTLSQDLHTLAAQTDHLAQKGMLDGVAGLIGNISTLMEATHQLIRTAAGIGVFLALIGLLLSFTAVLVLLNVS